MLKTEKNHKYLLILSIFLGLLIGVKYSGILYVTGLFLIFANKILARVTSFKKLIYFLLPILLIGLIWYLRNLIIKGNPFYPSSVLGFKGDPDFIISRGFATLFNRQTFLLALEALLSEYLIWLFLLPIFFILYIYKKTRFLILENKKYLFIAFWTFLVYLYLPSEFSRTSITSNVRFLHITFAMLILAAFNISRKFKIDNEIVFLAIINSLAILPQFSYQPKLLIIWIIISIIFFKIRNYPKPT